MFLGCRGAGRSRFPGDVPGCEQPALLGAAALALPPATTGASQTRLQVWGVNFLLLSRKSLLSVKHLEEQISGNGNVSGQWWCL